MIKIISINIQQDLHHHLVIPFLQREMPDVVCLQEIFQEDLYKYEEALGMKSFYKPECYIESLTTADGQDKLFGVAILTKHSATFDSAYIVGEENKIPVFEFKNSVLIRNVINTVLIWGNITDNSGNQYTIANTHFTWTPHPADATAYQIEDTKKLITVLDNKLKSFILIGDLNAPRGKGAFSMLAEKYKDNIPKEYDSSLDPNLHRVKGLKNMVDGLFSTSEYKVSNVKLVEGVSDHKGVVAYIERA